MMEWLSQVAMVATAGLLVYGAQLMLRLSLQVRELEVRVSGLERREGSA